MACIFGTMVLMYIIRLLRIDVNLPATCRFSIICRHAVDLRVREIIRNCRHYASNDTQRMRARPRIKSKRISLAAQRCKRRTAVDGWTLLLVKITAAARRPDGR